MQERTTAAMRNYLLRLGWGHGDVDIIPTEDAIKLFEISDIGRRASSTWRSS